MAGPGREAICPHPAFSRKREKAASADVTFSARPQLPRHTASATSALCYSLSRKREKGPCGRYIQRSSSATSAQCFSYPNTALQLPQHCALYPLSRLRGLGEAGQPSAADLRFSQLAQVLENLAGGFWRLTGGFLFLRVADHTAQLLTVGVRIEIQHFRHRVITLFNQPIAQLLQLVEQRNLLVVAVLQLIQRRGLALRRADAAFYQSAAAGGGGLPSNALRQFNGVTQLFIKRDLIGSSSLNPLTRRRAFQLLGVAFNSLY